MNTLTIVNALVCAVIAVRLLSYRRSGASYRPAASILAYVATVAAGSVPLLAALGLAPAATWPQLVLNATLATALLSVRGNITALFRPVDGKPYGLIVRALRRRSWW